MKCPLLLLVIALFCLPALAQDLNIATESGMYAHIMPTLAEAQQLVANNAVRTASGTGPLVYNGGPVILKATTYAIFWVPATLQTGAATSMTSHYQTVQMNLLKDYAGHSIDNNNTQYYQGPPTYTLAYIQNSGGFGGSYIDTSAYPASACSDSVTLGACLSDKQIRSEISRVMGIKAWTGGLNKMFLLFTSSGEGSCLSSGTCAYSQYCAYHSYFVNSSSQYVIYGNEPYGNPTYCQVSGAPTPNSDAAADTAATAASHELTEAITDPLLNAWYSSSGEEIGDLCAYYYGYMGWDSGKANEHWNTHYYLLQTEYDNYLKGSRLAVGGVNGPYGCFNVGPEF